MDINAKIIPLDEPESNIPSHTTKSTEEIRNAFKELMKPTKKESIPLKMTPIEYCKIKHGSQIRKFTGEPYYTHSIKVAEIVKEYTNDENLISTSLLHDTVEDTDATIEEIENLFNMKIALLVAELTSSNFTIKEMGKAKYLINKMNNMSDEALLIKLADRLDNVSGLHLAPEKFIERYKRETIEILDGLNRDLNDNHKDLIKKIRSKLG